jgi:hypothetical protein
VPDPPQEKLEEATRIHHAFTQEVRTQIMRVEPLFLLAKLLLEVDLEHLSADRTSIMPSFQMSGEVKAVIALVRCPINFTQRSEVFVPWLCRLPTG